MTATVNLNRPDFPAIAREAWGTVPDWIEALAAEAARRSATVTAKRIGYSPSVVSQVLRRKYEKGDMDRVEAAVRGALMHEVVACPGYLGMEIGRDQCLREQDMDNTSTSAVRTRVYHACRSGCPHSRLREVDDAG